MINTKPILTEKSLKNAKEGKYSFWIDRSMNKFQIKKEIGRLFDVQVEKVRTINVAGEIKKNLKGGKVRVMPRKKAIITTKDGKKIDVFEEKKK